MASFVELLQLSPTMSEGTLVKWKVKEGDTVKSGQIIAEVETDKAVMDHETFDTGTVRKLLVADGAKIPVGSKIMIVGKPDEDISALIAQAGTAAPAAAKPAAAPAKAAPARAAAPATPARSAPAPRPAAAPARPAPAAPKAAPAPAPVAAHTSNGGGERLVASPLARKVAQEAGLDLSRVAGTGPAGRIIKRDVETALASPAPAYAAAPVVSGEIEERPLSNIRRIIADRLVESKVTVPHFQLSVEIRAEALLEAQARVRKMYPDVKITITHILMKAMAMLAMRHEPIRTQWAGDHLRVLPGAHISLAVATPEGLITPVLRNLESKGLLQIVAETAEIVERGRQRRVKPEEMSGGVQTLSNLGMFPIDFFTAIINPPESSILAIGAIQEKVFVKDGQMSPGKSFSITMSCDHRVIDGAVGAKYLSELKAALEEPVLLLL